MIHKTRKHLLPFNWNNQLSEHDTSQFELSLKKGTEIDYNALVRLVESCFDYYLPIAIDVNPEHYYVLCQNDQLIAAVKYSHSTKDFIVKDVMVHPMYPENSIAHALYWLLKGCGGRLPLD